MNLLLTGATGFLGIRLATALNSYPDLNLTAAVRRSVEIPAAQILEAQSLDANTNWSAALANQQIIIHAAARAHAVEDVAGDQADPSGPEGSRRHRQYLRG